MGRRPEDRNLQVRLPWYARGIEYEDYGSYIRIRIIWRPWWRIPQAARNALSQWWNEAVANGGM